MYNTFLVVRAQLNLNLEIHKKIYLTKFCFLFFFWTKETMATQQGGNPPTTLLPPAIAPPSPSNSSNSIPSKINLAI